MAAGYGVLSVSLCIKKKPGTWPGCCYFLWLIGGIGGGGGGGGGRTSPRTFLVGGGGGGGGLWAMATPKG